MGLYFLIIFVAFGLLTINRQAEAKTKTSEEICSEVAEYALIQKDTQLQKAHQRHCKNPQNLKEFSGLIGAFYHLETDLKKKDKRREFYKSKLSETLGLVSPQNLPLPTPKWNLGSSISEPSALFFDRDSKAIWTLGDSGTGPFIAKIDSTSGQSKRFEVPSAKNVDWEAIVKYGSDIWILDVGDNRKTRKNVVLYRTRLNGEGLEPAEAFKLTYSKGPMDCEGAVVLDSKIYLFEKSYFQSSKIYSVDLKQSELQLVFEGYLPPGNLITDAGLTTDSRLFVLTYLGIDEIEHWTDPKKRKIKNMVRDYWGQAEGLSVIGPEEFLVGNEKGEIFDVKASSNKIRL